MSILKSILHRYNTTNQNYDTLHPETEHAQVTDFGQGVIAHLASSTLVSLVTSVSTGSVFGKMVEKLLEASGVQYNFTNANAWYICLGSLFGGLIIQGGEAVTDIYYRTAVTLPISMNSYNVLLTAENSSIDDYIRNMQYTSKDAGFFNVKSANHPEVHFNWMVIGR